MSRGADSGFTLLELAIAMMVMSIGLVAVLGALVAAVNSGRILREAANAELELVEAAENLRGTGVYVPCPSITPSTYEPAHPDVEVTAVRHWDGEETSPLVFLDDCPVVEVAGIDPDTGDPITIEVPVDHGLQQVVLSFVVDSESPQLNRSVTVVKRDPAWTPIVTP